MAGIMVINGGMLTTVQDEGRYGYQASGVQVSGVMDRTAALLANALVGNDELSEDAALLEATYLGPELEFGQDALAAVAGGMPDVQLDGMPVQPYRAIAIRAGQRLKVAAQKSGLRAYIAVSGGFATDRALGSRSTNLKLRLGGHLGRKLAAGDVLPVGEPGAYAAKALSGKAGLRKLPSSYVDAMAKRGIVSGTDDGKIRQIRVILGPQDDYFSRQSIAAFAEAVSIQIPPDGQPIIMLADHQTTGGYPKLATVATVDLPLLAQSMPGDRLQFRLISVQEAQQLLRQQHENMVEVINQMKEQAVLAVPPAGAKQFRLTINGEAFDVAIRQM